MIKEELQKSIEYRYSRKNINKHLRNTIEGSPEIMEYLNKGVQLIEAWRKQEFYKQKNKRLEALEGMDLHEVVMGIAMVILPLEIPMLFSSVAGQLAGHLNLNDKGDAIKTISELLAVVCETDLYDIRRNEKNSLIVCSNFQLPQELREFISETKYLPPMLVPPRVLTANNDSGYLTVKDTLILGKGNYHTDDICLDSLNRMNQVSLSLDLAMLNLYKEMPRKALNNPKAVEQFEAMRRESLRVYVDIAANGNEFWITHKVDKRGRTYSQGYHVNTQGSPFKRSIINFTKKEVIEGVC